MLKRKLTEEWIDELRPPEVGKKDYFDTGMPGLILRNNFGGKKTWCVPLARICATFPRVMQTTASLCRAFFSISGDVRGISSASLWSRIFNIHLLNSETRFEVA
jgi:hypothetical protein